MVKVGMLIDSRLSSIDGSLIEVSYTLYRTRPNSYLRLSPVGTRTEQDSKSGRTELSKRDDTRKMSVSGQDASIRATYKGKLRENPLREPALERYQSTVRMRQSEQHTKVKL